MKLLKSLTLAALLTAAGRPLVAQADAPAQASLDSTQVTIQRTILVLRDSLRLVDAASASLARDRQTTSDASLRSRATVMSTRCAAASRTAAATKAIVVTTARPTPDPRALRSALQGALTELEAQLNRCTLEFKGLAAPEKAEELRGYGIGKGLKVQQGIRRYELVLAPYYVTVVGTPYMTETR